MATAEHSSVPERARVLIRELLASERRALDAESAELDVRLQRLATRIDLHLALGGDFDRHDTDR